MKVYQPFIMYYYSGGDQFLTLTGGLYKYESSASERLQEMKTQLLSLGKARIEKSHVVELTVIEK